MQDVQGYTVQFPEGMVHVIIREAERTEKYHGHFDVRPQVEVTTDLPATNTDTARGDWTKGYLTYRGKQYRIEKNYYRVNGEWNAEHVPYGGGFRKENGGQVQSRTPTWEWLHNIVSDALAQFSQARPGWERESNRLALLASRHRWEVEAAKARQDAADAENEITRIDAELLTHATLPRLPTAEQVRNLTAKEAAELARGMNNPLFKGRTT